jgi:hypothetical protein
MYHSSRVIDGLCDNCPPEGDVCVAYLYCDYRDRLDQTPSNLIGALLKQALSMLHESSSIPGELISNLRKRQKKNLGEQLSLEECCQFLLEAVKMFTKFYVCIDALDECDTKHCELLLESLAKISRGCNQECSMCIFVTGRPHLNWKDYVRRHPDLGTPTHISLEAIPDDIRKYLIQEIENDDNYETCMNEKLKEEILERIVSTSDWMLVFDPHGAN